MCQYVEIDGSKGQERVKIRPTTGKMLYKRDCYVGGEISGLGIILAK